MKETLGAKKMTGGAREIPFPRTPFPWKTNYILGHLHSRIDTPNPEAARTLPLGLQQCYFIPASARRA
jgi:hypothetical protein